MGIAFVSAILFAAGHPAQQQPATISITLAGQSMIRSDLRDTAPAAVPLIKGLLQGDVIFTNLEATIAEKGETTTEGAFSRRPRRWMPCCLRLQLVSLSGNHAFDLKATGIHNTLKETESRKIARAGTGNNAGGVRSRLPEDAKGTVALVASASGLITPGGSATADRPGVNELRIEAGGKSNEASEDLPAGRQIFPTPTMRAVSFRASAKRGSMPIS